MVKQTGYEFSFNAYCAQQLLSHHLDARLLGDNHHGRHIDEDAVIHNTRDALKIAVHLLRVRNTSLNGKVQNVVAVVRNVPTAQSSPQPLTASKDPARRDAEQDYQTCEDASASGHSQNGRPPPEWGTSQQGSSHAWSDPQ